MHESLGHLALQHATDADEHPPALLESGNGCGVSGVAVDEGIESATE